MIVYTEGVGPPTNIDVDPDSLRPAFGPEGAPLDNADEGEQVVDPADQNEKEVIATKEVAASGQGFDGGGPQAAIDAAPVVDFSERSKPMETSAPKDFIGGFAETVSSALSQIAESSASSYQEVGQANGQVFQPEPPTSGLDAISRAGYDLPSNYDFKNASVKPGVVMQMSAKGKQIDVSGFVSGVTEAATALGVNPLDVATAIGFETGNTFDPDQPGPTSKWGKHRGYIQWGEPQAKEYGVDWNNSMASQLGKGGALVKYLQQAGVRPGMGLLDIYSAINSGRVGNYGAVDGKTTVQQKVTGSAMAASRMHAEKLFKMSMDESITKVAQASASAQTKDIVASSKRGSAPDIANVRQNVKDKFKTLQDTWGESITVVSGYRDPARNARAGGAKKSQHMHGNAFDLDVSGWDRNKRTKFIEHARAQGWGGIGVYANSIHIDVGGKRAWGSNYHSDTIPGWALAALSK